MPSVPRPPTATLLITCPDQKGIVAAVSDFLFRHDANILHSDQHQDAECGLFAMRLEWDLTQFTLSPSSFPDAFRPVAERFGMSWKWSVAGARPRVAILVSKQIHCLADLLYRHQSGELKCDIPLVIGNHRDGEDLVRFHGIEFLHLPTGASSKQAIEATQRKLFHEHRIDLIVLARYMQILSPELVSEFPKRIINIHHSFLPAFVGSKPYHQAFTRGVKLIGATSHYATEALDEGPIIEQDVIRISHRDPVEELVRKGQDLERVVLSRAVRWHLDHRIVVYGNKTVIFD